jgi:arsenite methyltransferase
MELWIGCVAGALTEEEFLGYLKDAGFVEASIEPTRIYQFDDAKAFLEGSGLDAEAVAAQVQGRVMGAFIRATKPRDPLQ